MARFNENQFNVPQFNQVEDLNAGQNSQQAAKNRPKRSVLLQQLLNYFDDADVRVRESRLSLDAQLLNAPALALEDLQLRLSRESAVTDLGKCPLNVDNFGTYFKIRVPDTYVFQSGADGTLLAPKVRIFTADEVWQTISEYDDRLPIPSRVELGGDPVPCRSLIVYELAGNGLKQEDASGAIGFPNHL